MRFVLGIALVALLFASPVFAASIPITNASFEEPDLPDAAGATWTNTLPGWVSSGDSFIELIGGFAADGEQHLGMSEGVEVSQDTGIPVAPNEPYTLTVNIGNRNDTWTVAGNQSTIGLYAGASALDGGISLGTTNIDASFLTDGTFSGDVVLTIPALASPPPGNIFVSLRSTGVNRSHFDNVRLEGVIPEPSSLGLVFMALLGLFKLRRK